MHHTQMRSIGTAPAASSTHSSTCLAGDGAEGGVSSPRRLTAVTSDAPSTVVASPPGGGVNAPSGGGCVNAHPPAPAAASHHLPGPLAWRGYDVDDGLECPICIETYDLADEIVVLPCRHLLHKSCLLSWTKAQVSPQPLASLPSHSQLPSLHIHSCPPEVRPGSPPLATYEMRAAAPPTCPSYLPLLPATPAGPAADALDNVSAVQGQLAARRR